MVDPQRGHNGSEPSSRASRIRVSSSAVNGFIRRDGHHFVVNRAGIPDSLFEAECCGHRRRAFTGPVNGRQRYMETASGGCQQQSQTHDGRDLENSKDPPPRSPLVRGLNRRLPAADSVRHRTNVQPGCGSHHVSLGLIGGEAFHSDPGPLGCYLYNGRA